MAKELKPDQLELRRKARRLAKAAGKSWKDLSQEERRSFFKQARDARSERPQQSRPQKTPTKDRPWRDKAKAAAEKAGKKWRDLSKEERQNYLADARKTAG